MGSLFSEIERFGGFFKCITIIKVTLNFQYCKRSVEKNGPQQRFDPDAGFGQSRVVLLLVNGLSLFSSGPFH